MSDSTESTTLEDRPAAEGPRVEPPARQQIQTDETRLVACYANFCRVTGTPEELVVDFGLNPQPMGVPSNPIPIAQRIVMNFYTAKRLLGALSMSIQRHEAVFGVLETDVQKRVSPAAWRAAGAQPPQQSGR